jgi:tetratricopeptide (TPR) repeat protein
VQDGDLRLPMNVLREVFCSYAPEDEKLFRELYKHLRLMERKGQIILSYNQLTPVGTDQAKYSDTHLATASLILLLISSNFLASDYCYGVEMQRALVRHWADEAQVIPILLRPVDWKIAPFAHLQVLPTNKKAVTSWGNRDEAFADVTDAIRRVVEESQHFYVDTPHAILPLVRNIPSYLHNSIFTGREEILLQLHNRFQATAFPHPQALCGLGGVGKTQIAVEYAYRHLYDYQFVLWVQAETREALISEYVDIAGLLNLEESKAQDEMIVVQAVKKWLEAKTTWLLILDNADDLTILNEFLPFKSRGHIVITTRMQAMGKLAERTEVNTLEQDLGALLLLRRVSFLAWDARLENAEISDLTLARQISEELGGLPLALDQAGAYIDKNKGSLSHYLELYKTRRADLLKHRGENALDHPKPIATTWSLSFENVELRNPAAANLLRLCAYLSPDAIPEELFMQGTVHLGLVLKALVADPIALDEAFAVLVAYSLLQRDSRKRSFSVHRLVQVVLRDSMDEAIQRDWMQRVVLVVNAAFPEVKFETWPQCEMYLSHALICVNWIEQEQMHPPEAMHLLLRMGWYLKDRARYKEAEDFAQRALKMSAQQSTSDQADIAQILTVLAEIYEAQGKYDEAEPWYKEAFDLYELHLKRDHPYIARSMDNLAGIYDVQGKYAEAEPLHLRALALHERVQGLEHLDTAGSLNNLACCYVDQGKYSEAEPLYQRAQAIYERQSGPMHPDTANGLNNLAELYCQQEKYIEAESLYQRALTIYEEQSGSEHPDTANTLHNLAGLYCQQEKYTEAEPLYQRALAIHERRSGPNNPNIVNTLNSLAHLYSEQKKYTEAETFLKRALTICERRLAPKHPDTANTSYNLARLYDRQGYLFQAEPLYVRALEIYEKQLESDHPHMLLTRGKYRELQRKMQE